MDSMFASTFSGRPVSRDLARKYFKYVNNFHSSISLPSIVLSFIQLIYIHIDLLLKDPKNAGAAPTEPAHTSNSREIDGISAEGGH